MTDADDPWASLADDLGITKPNVTEPESEAARGPRRRRRGADSPEPIEAAPPRGRKRSPRVEEAPADVAFEAPTFEVEPGEPAIESDVQADDETDESDGAPKKRRRRRSRKKKVGVAGAPGEGEAADADAVQSDDDAPDSEDDLTPLDNYSSWNMPSWQELIDGLHRP